MTGHHRERRQPDAHDPGELGPTPDDDPVTTDLVVLSRARVVMQQLLLRCVEDPLDADALQAAYDIQVMLRADLTVVRARLKSVLACV